MLTSDFPEFPQAFTLPGSDPHDVRSCAVPVLRLHNVETVEGDAKRLLAEEFYDLGPDLPQQVLRCLEGSRCLLSRTPGSVLRLFEIERHNTEREVQAAGWDDDGGV